MFTINTSGISEQLWLSELLFLSCC